VSVRDEFLRLAATEIAGADADGAAEGFDGNTCPGMEGGHRVAHVLKAHESLGIHCALPAVNDLIGSDNSRRGQIGTFLFQQIEGPGRRWWRGCARWGGVSQLRPWVLRSSSEPKRLARKLSFT